MRDLLSKQLAEFVVSLRYDALPSAVREMVTWCVMDWAGSAIRGSLEAPAGAVKKVLDSQGGIDEATYLGWDHGGPALSAALLNGASSHTVELDDLHRNSIIHPGAAIIPAALAAAEAVDAPGKALLEGVVAGYEVGIRIGESANPGHYYYWHATGTCGTFGAAAAAAKILELSEEEIIHALGSAGTQAAGLWQFHYDDAMSKPLHAGKSAQNGLLSALLAAQGFTGARNILEGEKGFLRACAPSHDVGAITAGLGSRYTILDNSFKIHASCRHTHGGIDLAMELRAQGVDHHQVEDMCYRTYSSAVDLVGGYTPESPTQCRFSLPFCGAVAMVHGHVGLDDFEGAHLDHAEVSRLMSISRVEQDEAADREYPAKWITRLECKLRDGTVLVKQTDHPRGDPENPLTEHELSQKFLGLAGSRLEERRAETLMARLKSIPEMKAKNLFRW